MVYGSRLNRRNEGCNYQEKPQSCVPLGLSLAWHTDFSFSKEFKSCEYNFQQTDIKQNSVSFLFYIRLSYLSFEYFFLSFKIVFCNYHGCKDYF